MTKQFVRVAAEAEIPEGESRVYEIEENEILVCRVEGKLHAVLNLCTHDDGPLGEGNLDGCAVECPRHGARFDVRTGEVLRMPAAAPLPVFAVKVENGEIWIEVEKE